MAFLALAYPVISETAFNWLQAYRIENDELFYGKVAPHFTIVFPLSNMTQTQFINEIEKQYLIAEQQLSMSEDLVQTLLQKAFRGELVNEPEEALCK